MKDTVECENCSEQWARTETDAGFCPECGGECVELDDICPVDDDDMAYQGEDYFIGVSA